MKSKQIGKEHQGNDKFSEMLEQSFEDQGKMKTGDSVYVTVINIKDKDFVFVKSETGPGMINRQELLDGDGQITVNPGEKLEAFFHSAQNGDNIFTISPTGKAGPAIIRNALENRSPLQGKIVRKNKGGFEIQMGDMLGFCPASMMEAQGANIGQHFTFLVVEVSGKRIIVSQRAYRDMERERQKDVLQNTLQEGDILTGTVTSLQNFGAFVDLGGMEGLVPISELSFKRVNHPSECLKSGQEVRVKVMHIDWKDDRLTLSIRALQENPWQGALPFDRGDIVEGVVESVKNFGVFVKLTENFTGLIPISESNVPRGQRPENYFQRGMDVRVMIQNIDRESERISLSVKRVKDADVQREYEEYMEQNNDEGDAGGISSFGKQLLASLGQDEDNSKS